MIPSHIGYLDVDNNRKILAKDNAEDSIYIHENQYSNKRSVASRTGDACLAEAM